LIPQGNHIHLICEADSAEALARGIQGWSVRVARGLNRVLGRRGPVFADRYHAEIITTPSQTRATLCYVLHNGRRHGERLDSRLRGADAYSSAWWFDGGKTMAGAPVCRRHQPRQSPMHGRGYSPEDGGGEG
jgi:hypothetical protein